MMHSQNYLHCFSVIATLLLLLLLNRNGPECSLVSIHLDQLRDQLQRGVEGVRVLVHQDRFETVPDSGLL